MKHRFGHAMAAYKRQKHSQGEGLLMGVRSICEYARIGPRTFYKWQQAAEFPAMRTPDGRWCTSRDLTDGWIISRWKAQQTKGQSVQTGDGHE